MRPESQAVFGRLSLIPKGMNIKGAQSAGDPVRNRRALWLQHGLGEGWAPEQIGSSRCSSSEHAIVTWAEVTEDGVGCTHWRDSLGDGLEAMSGGEEGGW